MKRYEERQICARLGQPVGGGYLVLLYPRRHEGEEIPTKSGSVMRSISGASKRLRRMFRCA